MFVTLQFDVDQFPHSQELPSEEVQPLVSVEAPLGMTRQQQLTIWESAPGTRTLISTLHHCYKVHHLYSCHTVIVPIPSESWFLHKPADITVMPTDPNDTEGM